ncbi:DNA-directed RNA polymerase subunit beta' [candidate division CPR3 bacterium 4484_211]|uniref:DNA-directed RNA polymerase subunit beta' n=1 Tax=candidate division CPR3 bacterium 4484_211 TaxID=1968527 RepID=A0A1W9NYK7_UNCC3|nr:MAG: DNA-directed RNA polymerase subunit beta' [candidate division CPR3 bacterium 4484_211]
MLNKEFDALKIALASPDDILNWSHGEVTKAETINYRTFKPEKDGLFCEKIFGPVRDFECYCGKYKGVRYKGVICDKCGVEVTRSLVRRERLGHITLASPIVHTWFLRRNPHKLPLVLDMRYSDLEAVIYFALYVVTSVDETKKEKAIAQVQTQFEKRKASLEKKIADKIQSLHQQLQERTKTIEEKIKKFQKEGLEKEGLQIRIDSLNRKFHQRELFLQKKLEEYLGRLQNKKMYLEKRILGIKPKDVLSEEEFHELSLWKADNFLTVGMGAEAILELLKSVDLDQEIKTLEEKLNIGKKAERARIVRRLKILRGLKKNRIQPSWMVLTVLPVIPPGLRPIVQLPGGRFATSDLNDLYRRVINRNNRLKELIQLGAPEIILQNEKRMLQEATDALIEGPRRTPKNRRVLKSLSEMLKGKQGRFRRNLLGKRVDYSGRAVIVVGPDLKVDQVGVPKEIALELFRPFVLRELILRDYAPNLKTAKEILEERGGEVWDILEEITHDHPVLLNRAPTLHRQNIQAFYPILIDSEAIQFHPAICAGFNADFDGDQMAIHIPLSQAAIKEAKEKMLSTKNFIKLADNKPIVDMKNELSLGLYYLTLERNKDSGDSHKFYTVESVITAYENEQIHVQTPINLLWKKKFIKTTVGRVILNLKLPPKMRFYNEEVNRRKMKELFKRCLSLYGEEATVKLVDDFKALGREFATLPGISFSVFDFKVPKERESFLREAEKKIADIETNYRRGLITEQERHLQIVDLWQKTTEDVAEAALANLDELSMIGMIIQSKSSKATKDTLRQVEAMRGPMVDSKGEIKETPIRSSTVEGASSFEGFLSAIGGRKGLIDTALLTANAGYLTRRLVDVSHDLLVREHDCRVKKGITIKNEDDPELFVERIRTRVALNDITHPKTGKVIIKSGQIIDSEKAKEICQAGIKELVVRSPLTCRTKHGVCQMCYGQGMDSQELVKIGEAVGVIAAESIGEPGTQLTLRTFHAAGIAKEEITQGLPRVDELFETRTPKEPGILAEISGKVTLEELPQQGKIALTITNEEKAREEFTLKEEDVVHVKNGQLVKQGTPLFTTPDRGEIVSPAAGRVKIKDQTLSIDFSLIEQKEYLIPETVELKVQDGDLVSAGDVLTEGNLSLEDITKLKGVLTAQMYLLNEIQKVYRSQAVDIHDKHIECIIKKMSESIKIEHPGDSAWTIGDKVNWIDFEETNKELRAQGKKPARGKRVILGISRASLLTRSWLSAASFEETTNVLAAAAIGERPQVDPLLGLKENVIIGKLIPTQMEPQQTEENL